MKRIIPVLLTIVLAVSAGCVKKQETIIPEPEDVQSEPAVTPETAGEPTPAVKESRSDEELCELAAAYYEAVHGERPPLVSVDESEGDEVTIHLYEDMGDHLATWDWYTVDRNTGKGTDFFGNEIDLLSQGAVG